MVVSIYNGQFSLRSLEDANYTINYIILFTLSIVHTRNIGAQEAHAEGPMTRASVVYVTCGWDPWWYTYSTWVPASIYPKCVCPKCPGLLVALKVREARVGSLWAVTYTENIGKAHGRVTVIPRKGYVETREARAGSLWVTCIDSNVKAHGVVTYISRKGNVETRDARAGSLWVVTYIQQWKGSRWCHCDLLEGKCADAEACEPCELRARRLWAVTQTEKVHGGVIVILKREIRSLSMEHVRHVRRMCFDVTGR